MARQIVRYAVFLKGKAMPTYLDATHFEEDRGSESLIFYDGKHEVGRFRLYGVDGWHVEPEDEEEDEDDADTEREAESDA